jgi:serine/threonine protein kinase
VHATPIDMADTIPLALLQSIQADSGYWYRNLQTLGEGGNATTYLVVATSGPYRGVLFAAKLFRKLSKPERRESFLQESQFLRTCEHPSIMRLYDAGLFDGDHPFFVAEFLPDTLFTVIRRGTASMSEKISYGMQLLSALGHLSQLDPPVVHRDIKPQNVFVKGKSCVLGDFGLMKHLNVGEDEDREMMKESIGVGMPFHYRTPDQVAYLKGETAIGPQSDIFQLGLVLAELFTGRNPERPAASFSDDVKLDRLGGIPGALSGGIAAVIERMLIPDPAQRPGAAKLLDAWEGIFKTVVQQAHALEGRAF